MTLDYMRRAEKSGAKAAERSCREGQVVEAAGVELFRVLITRNLLILGTATTAKKASLPDPLYVYCTKMLFALDIR